MVAHLVLRNHDLLYVEIGNIIAEILTVMKESKMLRRGTLPLKPHLHTLIKK